MPDERPETYGLSAALLASPAPMRRAHHHHEVELNFVFRGSVTYLHRGCVRRLEAGRLVAFWASTPHSLIAADPDTEMAWITVPLAWLLGWDVPGRFTRELLEGSWWLAPAGESDRFAVRAWVRELAPSGSVPSRRLLLELHACLLWLAEKATVAKQSARSSRLADDASGLRHVERMARCMAERFHENLTVADIAREAGLHPNYAMPLFRRRSGVTIRDYLLQHRVTRAQQLLLTTDWKVLDVALASGFGSLSAFYEAFGRLGRETPQAFRKRMNRSGD